MGDKNNTERFAPELLAGKVALVTGGGTGMGRATATEMARCGAKVVVLGRRLEVVEDCANEIRAGGGEALALRCDIREEDMIAAALEDIDDTYGGLDILVNNAGGQYVSPAKDITNKGFETVIRNNLIGTWQMTKAVADRFMFENGGRIIFITAATRSGLAGFAHTAAARGGVMALMKTLAFEWAEHGILLNAVAPGTIYSDILGKYPIAPPDWHENSRNILNRMGEPADVAGAVIFLSSDLGKFVTGEEWYIDGGETLHLAHDARKMIDAGKFEKRQRGDS